MSPACSGMNDSYLGGVKCNGDYGVRTLDKYTGMCNRKFHLEMQGRCI